MHSRGDTTADDTSRDGRAETLKAVGDLSLNTARRLLYARGVRLHVDWNFNCELVDFLQGGFQLLSFVVGLFKFEHQSVERIA